MTRARLTRREEQFLRKCRVARVATVGQDVQPHNVPICPHWDGEVLFFLTAKDSKKVRNLRNNPRACIVADDYYDDWNKLRGVMVQGTVAIVASEEEFRGYIQALKRKFAYYREKAFAPSEGDDVVVAVRPTHVVSWGLE